MGKKLLLCLLLLSPAMFLQAQTTVSGTVSAENGETLIGATVLEKGTTNGTVTDFDGKYELTVEDGAILEFSYTGHSTTEATVGGRTIIDLVLEDDVALLDEVVVVGYGTQKKSVVTGAISKVGSDDLEDMPVRRIEDALQGRTSGVRVVGNSGQPGDGATVRVRGTTSINGGDPLYVVDGVPIGGGIDYLNPNDIESIEVLKDAASASIYGTRAAAGVILVTTKSGAANSMSVNYSYERSKGSPWKQLALLNAREYGILMNESSVAAGGSVLFEDPDALGEGTDWQSAVFNDSAQANDHNLSISAGGEKSKYYVSFSYFDINGIVARDDSKYERFTARVNSSHEIREHLRFGNTLAYTYNKASGISTNSEFGSPLSRALNLDPVTPILETDPEVLASSVFTNFPVVTNADGVPYGISNYVTSEVLNPVAALAVQDGFADASKIVTNVYGELDFLGGFTLRSSIGADLAFWGNEGFTPIYYLNATNRNDITNYSRAQNNGLLWLLENTLRYEKVFGDHDVSAIIGTSAQRNKGQGIGGTIRDLPVNTLQEASLAYPTTAESQTFWGYEYLNTVQSYFGRLNYNYKSKYLLTATMRADGTSRFGANNKYGYFPAFSLGWNMTEEDFLLNNSTINYLKLRASWGVNGSDNIGDFRFVSTVGGARNYTFGLADQLVNGVSPNAIANPDLRWEETTQLNFGFDAKLFRKVSLTFDYFEKETYDMLLDIAVPGYVGNAGPVGNVASMEEKGVELELGYLKTFNKVVVDFGANISFLKNEVTNLGLDKDFLPGQTFSPQGLEITRTAVGQPVGSFYGYQTDGLFQNAAEVAAYTNTDGALIQPNAAPGDFRFVDNNGNGEIDPDDRTFIGDPTPDITYGFSLSVDYKNFDIQVFGQGIAGNEVFKATRRFDLQMANLTADALDRWTGEGTSNTYPRLVMNDPNQNFSRSSDFYVEDGSFFRIKTLQLGYNLSKDILAKVGFRSLRLYVSGNNLVTLTKYSGLDPEIGGQSYGVDRGIYPQPRYFLMGASATF